MSNNNTYIQMSMSDMQIANLLSKLNTILSTEQLAGMTLTGELDFAPANAVTTGGIRFNGTSMQFSADGGTTWQNMSSLDYAWKAGTAYSQGDVVLYSGAWYSCNTANTATNANAPGTNMYWRLLSLGSEIIFVGSISQLKAALEAQTSGTIYISGTLTGSLSANITASMSIWSDEMTSISATELNFNIGSGRNVYWHAKNTLVYSPDSASPCSISGGSGRLWIEHFSTMNSGLTMDAAVTYQEITGNIDLESLGIQAYWTVPDIYNKLVPRELGELSSVALADGLAIYAESIVSGGGGASGWLPISAIEENIAANTAKYWRIDSQGILAERPLSATTGYLYYATDTGDLYRYGDGEWDSGVHIQGPQGSPGSAGSDGSAGVSPEVTVTSVAGGTEISITDAEHPNGQTFMVSDGQDGQPAYMSIGSVVTLDPWMQATATISGTAPNYTLNLGIPRGSSGVASWGYIAGDMAAQADLSSALGAKQDKIDSDHKLPYSDIDGAPIVGSGVVTIMQGGTSKGAFSVNATENMSIALDAGGGGAAPDSQTITMTQDDKLQAVAIRETNSSSAQHIWVGTLAQYEAQSKAQSDDICIITDDNGASI